ncbi:uncharacterized protein VTP21DRAFT_5125 [Calcarisporiella thermophila]|uniref:uncharacterized protein n=1 Tax=Calcarisporiella thermophila TaxID=911321 RepID=UPI003743BB60
MLNDHDNNATKKSSDRAQQGCKRKLEQDEDSNDIAQTTESSRQEDLAKSSTKAPSKKLPPLPANFLNIFSDRDRRKLDDPALHQGRIRSVPFVEGNWATHVYAKIRLQPDALDHLHLVVERAQNTSASIHSLIGGYDESTEIIEAEEKKEIRNNKDVNNSLHISLSRCVFLKQFQIEPFVRSLRKPLERKGRFSINFTRLSCFVNDEKTRSFIGLEVGSGFDDLSSCLSIVDEMLSKYKQPGFYTKPRFHTSIAWALGGESSPITEEFVRNILAPEFEESLCEFWFTVEELECKIGNNYYTFKLR